MAKIVKKYPPQKTRYSTLYNKFIKDNPTFDEMYEEGRNFVDIVGMDGAVRINGVIAYLRERGLDFGPELSERHFSK